MELELTSDWKKNEQKGTARDWLRHRLAGPVTIRSTKYGVQTSGMMVEMELQLIQLHSYSVY